MPTKPGTQEAAQPLDRPEILAKIRKIAILHEDAVVAEDTAIRDPSLALDSLDHIEIVMGLEDAFGIECTDAEVNATKTFGDLVSLVETKRAALPETPAHG